MDKIVSSIPKTKQVVSASPAEYHSYAQGLGRKNFGGVIRQGVRGVTLRSSISPWPRGRVRAACFFCFPLGGSLWSQAFPSGFWERSLWETWTAVFFPCPLSLTLPIHTAVTGPSFTWTFCQNPILKRPDLQNGTKKISSHIQIQR